MLWHEQACPVLPPLPVAPYYHPLPVFVGFPVRVFYPLPAAPYYHPLPVAGSMTYSRLGKHA